MDNAVYKSVMSEIIDMNGGEFLYSPSITFYVSGTVIVSCSIRDTVTMEYDVVQASDDTIFQRIHDMTQRMLERREIYKVERRAELEKELEALS